jgi:hypothetical protein
MHVSFGAGPVAASARSKSKRNHDLIDDEDEEYPPAVGCLSEISNLRKVFLNPLPIGSPEYIKRRKTISRYTAPCAPAPCFYSFGESHKRCSQQRLTLPKKSSTQVRTSRAVDDKYAMGAGPIPEPIASTDLSSTHAAHAHGRGSLRMASPLKPM